MPMNGTEKTAILQKHWPLPQAGVNMMMTAPWVTTKARTIPPVFQPFPLATSMAATTFGTTAASTAACTVPIS